MSFTMISSVQAIDIQPRHTFSTYYSGACPTTNWFKSNCEYSPRNTNSLVKVQIESLLSPSPTIAHTPWPEFLINCRGTKRKRDDNESCHLLNMPTEILLMVASHLGSTSALKLSQTSHRLFQLRQTYFDTPTRRQLWASTKDVLQYQVEVQSSDSYLSGDERQRLYDASFDSTCSPVMNILHLRGILARRIFELEARLARSINNAVRHQSLLNFPILTIHDMFAVQEIQVALDRGFEPCMSCQTPRMDVLISRVTEADHLRKRNLAYSTRAATWRRIGTCVLGVALYYGFEAENLDYSATTSHSVHE